jgi:hypothetical protein
VLDRGDHEMAAARRLGGAGLESAAEREVVALCPTAREDHVPRICADERGDLGSGVVD